MTTREDLDVELDFLKQTAESLKMQQARLGGMAKAMPKTLDDNMAGITSVREASGRLEAAIESVEWTIGRIEWAKNFLPGGDRWERWQGEETA